MVSLPEEQWRAIPGHEGKYEVSNCGRVRSLERTITFRSRSGGVQSRVAKAMIRRPCVNNRGYVHVSIGRAMKLVHRLVAAAWLPFDRERQHVNHKNGIKTDNRVENLEYVTPKENSIHAFRSGLNKLPGNSPTALTVDEVRQIRLMPRTVKTREIIKALNLSVHARTVRSVRNGSSWKNISAEA